MLPKIITAYSDGSCYPNPGPGGWGFHIPELEVEGYGGVKGTTNNRMEMMAAIKAIRKLKELGYSEGIIVTDSNYVVKGVNEWRHGWKKRGWFKASGIPVVNRDLWLAFDYELESFGATMKWVKGHNGHEHNERADQLAGYGRESIS